MCSPQGHGLAAGYSRCGTGKAAKHQSLFDYGHVVALLFLYLALFYCTVSCLGCCSRSFPLSDTTDLPFYGVSSRHIPLLCFSSLFLSCPLYHTRVITTAANTTSTTSTPSHYRLNSSTGRSSVSSYSSTWWICRPWKQTTAKRPRATLFPSHQKMRTPRQPQNHRLSVIKSFYPRPKVSLAYVSFIASASN